MKSTLLLAVVVVALFSCGVDPVKSTAAIPRVQNVDLSRYLGTWYEIVRMPVVFEEGLDRVTANYSLRDDGKITVSNAGYRKGVSEFALGYAEKRFTNSTSELLVYFFLFFGAGYNIVDLESNYQYAVVAGDSKDYLWVLSRSPKMDDKLLGSLIIKAAAWGYDTNRLIKVNQE